MNNDTNNDTNAVLESSIIEDFASMQNFVETPYIKEITNRALSYIKAGFPVHFRGPTGTGKTTMALHLANKIGRQAVIMHGDAEYKTSDLVGSQTGYRFRRVNDQYIHSVKKYEEEMVKKWENNRLTIAAKNGYTLIYDEYTRSHPEANNVLLPVLQERMLSTNSGEEENFYIKVHPDFCAIFTSNPEEYAGVQKSQDALRDRLVTIDLDYFDYQTELKITIAKSGLPQEQAEKIVKIVRDLRESEETEFDPTIRGSILIAKTLAVDDIQASKENKQFRTICQEILTSETSRIGSKANQKKVAKIVNELIGKYA